MKRLLPLAVFCMATVPATAQTADTFTAADYAAVTAAYTDSLVSITVTSSVDVAIDTHHYWDWSSVTTSSGIFTRTIQPESDPGFPSAQWSVGPLAYVFASLLVDVNDMGGFTSSAMVTYGEKMSRQALSLVGLAGAGPTDSLVFPAQDIIYSSPRVDLQFPMTINSQWNSSFSSQIDFNITFAGAGLNQTPGMRKSHRTDNFTVAGWGKIKLLNVNAKASDWIPILQVKHYYTIVDSFFLAGSPAPSLLLSQFGLTQGMIVRGSETSYYRPGDRYPIAEVTYMDSMFTTPDVAIWNLSRLPITTSIQGVSAEEGISVFPNPGRTGEFHIRFDKPQGAYDYSVFTVSGARVAQGQLKLQGQEATIQIGEQPSGIYFISISRKGQVLQTLPVSLID